MASSPPPVRFRAGGEEIGDDARVGNFDTFTNSHVRGTAEVAKAREGRALEANSEVREEDPMVDLKTLRECIHEQIRMREELKGLVSLCFICFLVIYVLIEQLDTSQLFATAMSASIVMHNAGESTGMDEVSLAAIVSEAGFWEFVRVGLIPAVMGKNWFADDAAFRSEYSVRTDCGELIESGESCERLMYPVHTSASNETIENYYKTPSDDQQTRKYNLLLGGIKIEQTRAPFQQCPQRRFLDTFPGFAVKSFAPAFKCYQEQGRGAIGSTDKNDKLDFDHLYPRGTDSHIRLLDLAFPPAGTTRHNATAIVANSHARKFPALFNMGRIITRAKRMLLLCLEGQTCQCAPMPDRAGQAKEMARLFHEEVAMLQGNNKTAYATAIVDETFFPSEGGDIPSYLSDIDLDQARRECMEAQMEVLRNMLRAQFTPVDDKYAIYIDVTTSADVINDILKFTQAHGWIDQMTRQVTTTYTNYNPNTNSFTATRIKCQFGIGGEVFCRGGIQVLRVGHYDGFSTACVVRLAMEAAILAFTVWMALGEWREVRSIQTDLEGTIVKFEVDGEDAVNLENVDTDEQKVYVRMDSGTRLHFPPEKLRPVLTEVHVTEKLKEAGFDKSFMDVYTGSSARQLFCANVAGKTFAPHAKLTHIRTRKLRKKRTELLYFILSGKCEARDPHGSGKSPEWVGLPGMILATGLPFSALQDALLAKGITVKASDTAKVECLELRADVMDAIEEKDQALADQIRRLALSLRGVSTAETPEVLPEEDNRPGEDTTYPHLDAEDDANAEDDADEPVMQREPCTSILVPLSTPSFELRLQLQEVEFHDIELAQRVRLKRNPNLSVAIGYYWRDYKNILDWMMISMICIGAAMWMMMLLSGQKLDIKAKYDLATNPQELTSLIKLLEELTNWFRFYRIFAGGLIIVLVAKTIDATGFYPPVRAIIQTLTRPLWPTFYFLLIFILFMIGSAASMHIAVGHTSKDFSTVTQSMRSCLDILVGSFDADAIFGRINPNPALVYFFYAYNILMVWIMINVFIAIVSDAYAEAVEQYTGSPLQKLIERHDHPFTWLMNPYHRYEPERVHAFIDDLNRVMTGKIKSMHVYLSESGASASKWGAKVSEDLMKKHMRRYQDKHGYTRNKEGEWEPVEELPGNILLKLFRLHMDQRSHTQWIHWNDLDYHDLINGRNKWSQQTLIPKMLLSIADETGDQYENGAFVVDAPQDKELDKELEPLPLKNKSTEVHSSLATLQRSDPELFSLAKVILTEINDSMDNLVRSRHERKIELRPSVQEDVDAVIFHNHKELLKCGDSFNILQQDASEEKAAIRTAEKRGRTYDSFIFG